MLVVEGHRIPVNKITVLHIDENTKWWFRFKAAEIFLIAGTGYMLLEAGNSSEPDGDTLLAGGTMIGAGLLCKLFIGNKLK